MKFWSDKFKLAESNFKKSRQELELSERNFNIKLLKLEEKLQTLKLIEEEIKRVNKEVDEKIFFFQSIYDETFNTISWLTDKYSEFYFLVDEKNFVYPKYNSSGKCIDAQKEFAKENKKLRKRNLDLEFQLKQIENLMPDFQDVIESNINDDLLDDVNIETIQKIDFLVPREQQKILSKQELLQNALNNYVSKRKSKSVIGKDYERYIGFLFETKGYTVEYHGIKYGFNDLGIDLICKKDDETLLIQCKNWRQSSNIHENAINQLFGTSIKYYIDKFDDHKNTFRNTLFEDIGIPFNKQLQPIFITTTKLTDRALEYAKILKIQVLEIPFERNYPRIKCNIGKDEFGNETKIYHLPFDQLYDRVQNIKNGGFYALTIKEAEDSGYRKAFRWRGE